MQYRIELKPKAGKDLKALSESDRNQVIERLDWLENDLRGDVKKLTNHSPEYRMRAGVWRVLFEIVEDRVIIYRVLHRSQAYR